MAENCSRPINPKDICMVMDCIKSFGHGCATALEKTTLIFAVLIYLTTIITAIGLTAIGFYLVINPEMDFRCQNGCHLVVKKKRASKV